MEVTFSTVGVFSTRMIASNMISDQLSRDCRGDPSARTFQINRQRVLQLAPLADFVAVY
jgi:hypothetical protein